jgi:hypothetical protein
MPPKALHFHGGRDECGPYAGSAYSNGIGISRNPLRNLESTESRLYAQAQEVFETMTGRNPQPQSSEAGSIFSVTCQNGHVSYFDKRRVCSSNNRKVVRGDGAELDELYLKCSHCDEEMIVHVNCEDYR